MPVKAHAKQQTVYRGITTHHHWKQDTHHNFQPQNHKVLIIIGAILVIAIICLGLSQA